MKFFGGYVAYYLLGWYIVHIGVQHKKVIYFSGILSLFVVILYAQTTKDSANAYTPMSIFVLAYSVAIFVALNSKSYVNIGDKAKRFIINSSNLSFGVYAVHLICMTLSGGFLGIFMPMSVAKMIGSFVLTSVMSFVVSFVASKIPIIKKAFRM